MKQLGASLNKTISIHNVNEPEYELIVIKRDLRFLQKMAQFKLAQNTKWRSLIELLD